VEVLQGVIEKFHDKGAQIGADGNIVGGFLVYFAGDLLDIGADPLKIGEGVAQASVAANQGHYGQAAWYVLQDGFRAVSLIPGIALATRAAKNGLAKAGTIGEEIGSVAENGSRSAQAWRNLFRPWEKAYDIGKGTLKTTNAGKWTFKIGDDVVINEGNIIKESEETVYRVIGKEFDDPTVMSGLEGRWNSEGTQVLYTSRNKDTAIAEFLEHNPGAKPEDYKIFEMKLKPKTSLKTDVLPEDKLISRSIGDTVKNSSNASSQAMVVRSKVVSNEENVIIMSEDIIENFEQVF
jgi:hypothetical protein